MTDLELTKLCAEAMGYTGFRFHGDCLPGYECSTVKERPDKWWPLRDDAQAMALVKRFKLASGWDYSGLIFCETHDGPDDPIVVIRDATDLNRAIVECVAKAQALGNEVATGTTK